MSSGIRRLGDPLWLAGYNWRHSGKRRGNTLGSDSVSVPGSTLVSIPENVPERLPGNHRESEPVSELGHECVGRHDGVALVAQESDEGRNSDNDSGKDSGDRWENRMGVIPGIGLLAA